MVIVEYCRYGNIQNYLIRNRANFINQVDAKGQINPSIGAERLVDPQFVHFDVRIGHNCITNNYAFFIEKMELPTAAKSTWNQFRRRLQWIANWRYRS